MQPSAILVGVELEASDLSFMTRICRRRDRTRLSASWRDNPAKNVQAPRVPRAVYSDGWTAPSSFPSRCLASAQSAKRQRRANGREGALRRRTHRARPYRVVGRRPGLALGARMHPGETTRRRRAPPRPPRTDDVHGRQAADERGRSRAGRRRSGRDRAARGERRTRRAVSPPDRCRERRGGPSLPRGRRGGSDQRVDARPRRAFRPFASRATGAWSTCANASATRSRSKTSRTRRTSTSSICARAFRVQGGMPTESLRRTSASHARRSCSLAACERSTWRP